MYLNQINKLSWPLVFALVWMGCKPGADRDLIIENARIFDSIPSVSGIAVKQDTVYMVCDDGTGIYKVNIQNFSQTKIPLQGFDSTLYRESKSVKHDFESACFVNRKGKEYLIAAGSGSKSTSRDSLLLFNTNDYYDQTIISLHDFYKHLRLLTNTDSTQWNIEGITIAADSLLLCNRGNNEIISCSTTDFFLWLDGEHTFFPGIMRLKLDLPSINNHEARLSGICTIDKDHILFCASVEDTPDWTKDGPVLGSYFGIYSFSQRKIITTYLLKGDHNKPLKEKIESVDLLQKMLNDDHLILAAGDNDNGTSKLFRIVLKKNQPAIIYNSSFYLKFEP